MIKLKRPIKENEAEALEFKQEFIDNGEKTWFSSLSNKP